MTLWAGKAISSLTDEELMDAINSVAHMENFRFDKDQDPRLQKKNHRLNKIFQGKPIPVNPNFTELQNALIQEYQIRKSNEPQEQVP